MDLETAVNFLRGALPGSRGRWADIGAGSGIFTLALDQLLEKGSIIYAADKNPHLLYKLQLNRCRLMIEELDFTKEISLPEMDGILMANALHYAPDPVAVLKNVLQILRPGCPFLLIEYELERPLSPWIPYPVPFGKFEEFATHSGLSEPEEISRISSAYGHEHLYLARSEKL